MLTCRNCRKNVSADDGCAICLPLKAQLVNEGEDESDRPSLSDVGAETVAALRYALRRANDRMRDRDLEEKLRGWATADVLRIGNTVAKVLEAARKLQTDGLAAIRNMSFLERAELFLVWYADLAPAYRHKVRAKMDEYEAKLAQPRELPDGIQS